MVKNKNEINIVFNRKCIHFDENSTQALTLTAAPGSPVSPFLPFFPRLPGGPGGPAMNNKRKLINSTRKNTSCGNKNALSPAHIVLKY